MRILVSGGAGLIAAGVIRELLAAEHHLRVLSRKADRGPRNFPAAIETFAADFASHDRLVAAITDCGAVVHLATVAKEQPPDITYQKINVDGTRHLLEAAAQAGAPYFIHLSALGADRGASRLQKSRRLAEELVQGYAGPWLILRPAHVYGPGDDKISLLLKLLRVVPAIPVASGGDQPLQPLWYADLGAVIAQAVAHRGPTGKILALAGPEVTTINEIFDRLAKILGRTPTRLAAAVWLARFGAIAGEALGGTGKELLEHLGLGVSTAAAQLKARAGENVISDPAQNALLTEFRLAPTPLQEGLELVNEALSEQTHDHGVTFAS
jgi:NADH dehydrogenase